MVSTVTSSLCFRQTVLPVSMRSRLLLLRLRSLRSLEARNSLGFRCPMVLLEKSIFTMSEGRSAGMVLRSGEGERKGIKEANEGQGGRRVHV